MNTLEPTTGADIQPGDVIHAVNNEGFHYSIMVLAVEPSITGRVVLHTLIAYSGDATDGEVDERTITQRIDQTVGRVATQTEKAV